MEPFNKDDEDWGAPKEEGGIEIEDRDKIRETLDRIYAEFHLIIHQTNGEIAKKIVTTGEYFKGPLDGTTLMQSPETIMNVLPELDSDNPATGVTHDGANGAVIMSFPRSITDKLIEDDVISKVQGMTTIDDALIDLYNSGFLAEIGMPNNLIVGYYTNGKFCLNQKVNFEIPESWKETEYS